MYTIKIILKNDYLKRCDKNKSISEFVIFVFLPKNYEN